ncbi:hypothetical protein [Chthonobacter albigriseus]|uniref:hypothetical protein n=1 Tax=Chthonobacter albigriseus TaxID=1683161 RepID=UPI0015EE5B9E|nr:hypothetical protein [Chthonobacter albigriseus]
MLLLYAFSFVSGFAASVGSRRSIQSVMMIAIVAVACLSAAVSGSTMPAVTVQALGAAFVFIFGSAATLVLDPVRLSIAHRLHPHLG